MDTLQQMQLQTKRGFTYRYYVSTTGSTAKPTLLLLHGWPDSALLWQYMIPRLSQLGLKLVVPDLLGYALQLPPNGRRRQSILDAEGVDKVIPIGHDFGCWFTFKFQTLYSERCVAAVHIGIPYMPPMPVMPDLDTLNALMKEQLGYERYTYFNLFTSPEAPKLFSENLDSVWHMMHGDQPDWIRHIFCTPNAMCEFISSGSTDVPLRPYAKNSKLYDTWAAEKQTSAAWEPTFCWYKAFTDGVQSEEDKNVPEEKYVLRCPVLAVMCTGDGVNPPETLELPKQAGLLPDLREEVLEVGHWCTYEQPEKLSNVIIEFVKKRGFAQ